MKEGGTAETRCQKFDEVLKPFGGRMPWETTPELVRQSYAAIVERAENLISAARSAVDGLPPIHFGIIRNERINAFALKSEGEYFIGVTTGTIYMLRLVIGRMLADPGAFESIGDASVEASDLPPLAEYSPMAEEMSKRFKLESPRDALRTAYATFLQDQAMMFLIGHEISHISRGHVDFLKSEFGTDFSELGWFSWFKKDTAPLDRQALELDADGRTTESRVDSVQTALASGQTIPWAPDSDPRSRLIHDTAVAINILFRIFGDSRFSSEGADEATHPPLAVRLLLKDMAMLTGIHRRWGEEFAKSVRRELGLAHAECEIAFARALGDEPSSEAARRPFTPQVRTFADRLILHWNESVRPRVQPFSWEF